MFLNLLSEQQKSSFLAMATKVILADGIISPEEEAVLDLRIAEMGGHVRAPAEEIYGISNTDIFDTRQARVIVLLELYVLVMSDSKYAPQEQEVMAPLADAWSMNEDEIESLKNWSEKAAPLSVSGWTMVMTGTIPEDL
ncbi:hypothetical protein [Magnetospira sp. QH-2]|uniref:hypothetical protein n=1 Tax=Magnetospira sp. (strain QH-2) TaxID=1288970 RepID=UPI0003E8140F|nr:hypothetical protein [Magnetospira sp. QH-2]CCQ74312.1 Protein of unknown function [Magnetospira sp. QH-2]